MGRSQNCFKEGIHGTEDYVESCSVLVYNKDEVLEFLKEKWEIKLITRVLDNYKCTNCFVSVIKK